MIHKNIFEPVIINQSNNKMSVGQRDWSAISSATGGMAARKGGQESQIDCVCVCVCVCVCACERQLAARKTSEYNYSIHCISLARNG